jgi:hypothetical protein
MKTKSSLSGLQSRSEQPRTTKAGLPRIDFASRRVNRRLSTTALLNLLRRGAPGFFELAEVVGRWVWIQFECEPAVETRRQLAQLGFHWNATRQAWQHPCGVYRDAGVTFNPRRKFGSYFAADMMLP